MVNLPLISSHMWFHLSHRFYRCDVPNPVEFSDNFGRKSENELSKLFLNFVLNMLVVSWNLDRLLALIPFPAWHRVTGFAHTLRLTRADGACKRAVLGPILRPEHELKGSNNCARHVENAHSVGHVVPRNMKILSLNNWANVVFEDSNLFIKAIFGAFFGAKLQTIKL